MPRRLRTKVDAENLCLVPDWQTREEFQRVSESRVVLTNPVKRAQDDFAAPRAAARPDYTIRGVAQVPEEPVIRS